ncbi:hypothetical protein [Roseburia hominis]|uniref:hypothetical protein n=1 Tax=Roseburia hominis TaxID=301301 RepID=UPI00266B630E|nr:hypothetical protein [Roseburia hominis]
MEQIYEIEPLLKAGVCIQIHPQGYSMYPFIDPRRDEVVLAGIEDGSALRRGDVVLYRRENGMLVLHRIYKIGQDGLYLLGDHQTAIEGPVRREQVKGKMTGTVRDGRYMDVGNPGYRMLSVVWLWLRPARRAIMVPAARLRRMVRFALCRRNNKRYNK